MTDPIDRDLSLPPGLYVVATPIGNLRDITLRALDTLNGADEIACEDTRVTGKILSRYAIDTRMTRYDDHTGDRARDGLTARLKGGAAIALVSDAGLPGISDPGYKLVQACIDEDIPVTVIPGANAALTGLVLSGQPTDRFLFAGYLPSKHGQRTKVLENIAGVPASLIFYESAKRLAASLTDMAVVLGDRPAAVARELTKLHEELRRDNLSGLAEHYQNAGAPKGEIVVVVGAPEKNAEWTEEAVDNLLAELLTSMSVRDAAREAAARTGQSRKILYDRALGLAKTK